jgi:MtN3 and saliva related transmembrane protein
MNNLVPTIVGLVAAFGTTAAWLPQVVRTLKTRSAKDFSWPYLCLFSCGVTLWMVYGFMRKDVLIVGANAITLVLVLGVVFVKSGERD